MMKNMKRFAFILCALILCVSTLGMAAFAADAVTAKIPVTVGVSGTLPQEAETFQIQLTADEAGFPMPAGTENGVYVTGIQGAGSAVIEISYDHVGVYTYTLQQIAGTNADCIYSTDVYAVTVFVTNAETGGLEVTTVAYKAGATEKGEIEFENRYANPDFVTITAIKTMDGKTPADGAFAFQLVNEDGEVLCEVVNTGRDVIFPEILCDVEGTFKFQVKEKMGTDDGILYDTTVYEATIVIVKDENGDYQATLTYEKDGEAYQGTPLFENKTAPAAPETGDNANIGLYFGLMVAAIAAMAVLMFVMKRQKKTV